MTFYEQEVRRISAMLYPRPELSRRIVQAKEYIDRHFQGPVDLSSIAGKAFVSKFHFLRLFKQHYGMTPHQYLTAVRLREARRLLAEGLPVSQVCGAVGFDSISSFKGLFKRYWGRTPSMLKKAILKTGPSKKDR
jgi:AraC-like DNA-binding protein